MPASVTPYFLAPKTNLPRATVAFPGNAAPELRVRSMVRFVEHPDAPTAPASVAAGGAAEW
jgi:hypothetical protein